MTCFDIDYFDEGRGYGNGVYFGNTADIAHVYAPPGSDRLHTMLLCKLVTGRSHLGAEHLDEPWTGYDSCRNADKTYMVIFDVDCILPIALIKYTLL